VAILSWLALVVTSMTISIRFICLLNFDLFFFFYQNRWIWTFLIPRSYCKVGFLDSLFSCHVVVCASGLFVCVRFIFVKSNGR